MPEKISEDKSELAVKLKKYRISDSEYSLITEILGRPPRGLEWALFSALWSEHCSYKSSKVHLKKLFNKGPQVLESFGENAGVIDLGEGERVAFKMESHNHPSFIEPYQGAATGVGGILRDIFTMGARPIALANYLCFGEKTATRMPAIIDGVVRGIGGYGNCVGVPTITGQTEFDATYNGNVLVNAMALGLFRPGETITSSKAKGVGNWVVYVGAKTGRDGVHGAAMASESFAKDSAAKRPTVQIGDPFFEKLLIESCLEVIQAGLVVAIQDMGAAGLTSSSFEMAAKGEVGFKMHLDRVPLRDPSLTPEDILLSESQERMLLVCEPANLIAIQSVFARWQLDAVCIGEVTQGSEVELYWHGEKLLSMDPRTLTDHAPQYQRPFKKWQRKDKSSEWQLPAGENKKYLMQALRSPLAGSRDAIFSQYDSKVGAETVLDCSETVGVVRLPDTGRMLGMVLGCRPYLMRADADIGGFDAVALPVLELAALGFKALGVTDCLNFGNPEKEETMTEFVAALNGLNLAASHFATPIISGNVSFYNETNGQNITPTPSTGVVGVRPWGPLPRGFFHKSNEVVGVLSCTQVELDGLAAEFWGSGPGALRGNWDVEALKRFVSLLQTLSLQQTVSSVRVVGKFGLGYALARMCLDLSGKKQNPAVGAVLTLDKSDLFKERLYEVVVSVAEEKLSSLLASLREARGVKWQQLGRTGGAALEFKSDFVYSLSDLQSDYLSSSIL